MSMEETVAIVVSTSMEERVGTPVRVEVPLPEVNDESSKSTGTGSTERLRFSLF